MLDSWIIDDGRGLTRPQASRRLVETALSSYALRPGTRLRSPVALGANSGYGLANDCLLVSTPLVQLCGRRMPYSGRRCRRRSVGYRWQFGGGPIVLGLEAEGDWASAST